jgi:hypothetical protein
LQAKMSVLLVADAKAASYAKWGGDKGLTAEKV